MATRLYEILAVPSDATEMEIRSAYGKRVMELPTRSTPISTTREELDRALKVLTDPELRVAYDRDFLEAAGTPAGATIDPGEAAFRYARNGGLWFAAGGVITAITYVSSAAGGGYFVAWGAVIFGLIQFARGALMYLRLPAPLRRSDRVAVLAALFLVGTLSSGYVLGSENGLIQDPVLTEWNATVTSSSATASEAADLVGQVYARPGTWSSQDSADMARASVLYGQVADQFAKTRVPSELTWYRDGLLQNYRDATAVTKDFSLLTSRSTQAELDALGSRWDTRISQYQALQTRFDQWKSGKK